MSQMGANSSREDYYLSRPASSRWLRYGGLTITAIVALSTSAALWTTKNQPLYSGKFQLLANNQGSDTITVDTQKQLLLSQKVLAPLTKKINPDRLTVNRLPNTTVLEVSYKDSHPEKILQTLNDLSKLYIDYGTGAEQTSVNLGSTYVDAQLKELRQKVKHQQDKLQQFRQSQQSLTPQEKSQYLNNQLATLENQLTETKARLGEANSLVANLSKQVQLTPTEAIAASAINNSSRYQALLDKLQALDVDIAQQSAVFKPNSPVIETLNDKRSNLAGLVDQEAKKILGQEGSNIQGLSAEISPNPIRETLSQQLIQTTNTLQQLAQRETILEDYLKQVKAEIDKMPTIARQYDELQQGLQIYNESLARYQATQEKLQLDKSVVVNSFTMISPPRVNGQPTYPTLPYNVALAAVTGLILGLASAAAMEVLNTNFYPEDLRNVID
ncbi:MAG: hypothetical protein N5P05_000296 [Chroococcopsis gigantea SAG 12.99]|jgi:uncharacterized protein involved in exopolysaccharide biosynthesis|nr:hypothetical protein [Chroococcopsis gigantea SAG 12.99]